MDQWSNTLDWGRLSFEHCQDRRALSDAPAQVALLYRDISPGTHIKPVMQHRNSDVEEDAHKHTTLWR